MSLVAGGPGAAIAASGISEPAAAVLPPRSRAAAAVPPPRSRAAGVVLPPRSRAGVAGLGSAAAGVAGAVAGGTALSGQARRSAPSGLLPPAGVGIEVDALAGPPPFRLFASEPGIARSTASAGLGRVLAIAPGAAAGRPRPFTRHAAAMPGGRAPDPDPTAEAAVARGAAMPLALALIAAAVLGAVLDPPRPPLRAAATIVGAP